MVARVPVVGGNWKMNLDTRTCVELARVVARDAATDACQVVVYPPFPYLEAVGRTLADSAVTLGAQDVYHQPNGAFTGEVSVSMLADVGVRTVLVGHSERRHVIGEDDQLASRKLAAIVAAGLGATLCVGETLEQRKRGATDDVTRRQIETGLAGVDASRTEQLVIAYEPVWAIGTGRTATPDDAQRAHASIRSVLSGLYNDAVAGAIRIQYGGSVKPGNAADLFACPDVDGFLVGGASLVASDFTAIVGHAASPNKVDHVKASNA